MTNPEHNVSMYTHLKYILNNVLKASSSNINKKNGHSKLHILEMFNYQE